MSASTRTWVFGILAFVIALGFGVPPLADMTGGDAGGAEVHNVVLDKMLLTNEGLLLKVGVPQEGARLLHAFFWLLVSAVCFAVIVSLASGNKSTDLPRGFLTLAALCGLLTGAVNPLVLDALWSDPAAAAALGTGALFWLLVAQIMSEATARERQPLSLAQAFLAGCLAGLGTLLEPSMLLLLPVLLAALITRICRVGESDSDVRGGYLLLAAAGFFVALLPALPFAIKGHLPNLLAFTRPLRFAGFMVSDYNIAALGAGALIALLTVVGFVWLARLVYRLHQLHRHVARLWFAFAMIVLLMGHAAAHWLVLSQWHESGAPVLRVVALWEVPLAFAILLTQVAHEHPDENRAAGLLLALAAASAAYAAMPLWW